MEDVFNAFNVVEDVREIICKKLHESNIKEINKVVNEFIGYDNSFNWIDTNSIIMYINKHFVFTLLSRKH